MDWFSSFPVLQSLCIEGTHDTTALDEVFSAREQQPLRSVKWLQLPAMLRREHIRSASNCFPNVESLIIAPQTVDSTRMIASAWPALRQLSMYAPTPSEVLAQSHALDLIISGYISQENEENLGEIGLHQLKGSSIHCSVPKCTLTINLDC